MLVGKLQSATVVGNGSELYRLRLAAGPISELGMAAQRCFAGCRAGVAVWPNNYVMMLIPFDVSDEC